MPTVRDYLGTGQSGFESSITLNRPSSYQAGDVTGRKVTVAAVDDGSVTGSGTATHWALTDGTGELLAAEALDSEQSVTSGNDWTLPAFDIEFPDPA